MKLVAIRVPLLMLAVLALVACKSAPAADAPTPAPAAAAPLAAEPAAAPAAPAAPQNPGDLLAPGADLTAPEQYTARLETTKGEIVIDVTRAWSPRGADRFYTLLKLGYYDDTAFFRVVAGFMAQIGIHGDPRVNEVWRERRFPDDPVLQPNARGMVSFATSGPNSRVNQFFINMVDNSRLDAMGFSPFGKVRDMAPVDALHSGYGEGAPAGMGPQQARIQREGNAYLKAEFPQLDYIVKARVD
jgi:peptidyl-prolyl cis-trans isomerase A (cyclophilin A)